MTSWKITDRSPGTLREVWIVSDEVDQQWTWNPYIWGIAVITSHTLSFFTGFVPTFLLARLATIGTVELFGLSIAVGAALGGVNYFRTARHTATPIYHFYIAINRRWPW